MTQQSSPINGVSATSAVPITVDVEPSASTPATAGYPRAVTADGKYFFDRRAVPPELLHPPGIVGEICQWLNATARYPQPLLALANSLCLWGAVVGRKVATDTDLRSNIYAIGVAESGAGKDHGRKQIKRLVASAGLGGALLGGEDLASDAAILKSLKQRPSQLMQLDEIGHAFAGWNSKNAASYQQTIPALLMKIFTSANTLLPGKEYAGKERVDIHEPNLCLFGTSVRDMLYAHLRRDQIEDGLLGRMLVFETDDNSPAARNVPLLPPPMHIASQMRQWHQRTDLPAPLPLAYEPGDLERLELPTYSPIVVTASPEANQCFERLEARCRTYREQLRGQQGLDALWSRAREHAMKLALVVASGCGFAPEELAITAEHAEYAVRLVTTLIMTTCYSVIGSVHANTYEKNLTRILGAITAAGSAGLTRTGLLRRFQDIRGPELHEILERLQVTRQVRTVNIPSGPQGGRPGQVIVAAGTV